MWLFDEGITFSKEEALEYAQDGGRNALHSFPEIMKNDAETMLFLAQEYHLQTVLDEMGEALRKDKSFLTQLANNTHYIDQGDFFDAVHPNLKNDHDLLTIFAQKKDDSNLKTNADEARQLFKHIGGASTTPIARSRKI